MDLSPYHGTIIFVHVVGVLLFLLAHGVSAGVIWRLRSERDPATIRALLDFSRRTFTLMTVGFLLWFFGGILAGFSGNHWTSGRYWIWASLVIALIVIGAMTPLGRMYLNRVRTAVGIDHRTGAIDSSVIVDQAVLEAAIGTGRPVLVASLGIGAVVVLSALMMFKPF